MINKVIKKISNDNLSFCYEVTFLNGEVWSVPHDEANRHYQEIQEWIADGGTVIDNGGGE
jgi:hypothetical protein